MAYLPSPQKAPGAADDALHASGEAQTRADAAYKRAEEAVAHTKEEIAGVYNRLGQMQQQIDDLVNVVASQAGKPPPPIAPKEEKRK